MAWVEKSTDYSYEAAANAIAAYRTAHPEGRVGFVSGCFDLLHGGHQQLLKECRKQCDFLVVSVTPDATVRRSKSVNSSLKPVRPETCRADLVNDLAYTDLTVLRQVDDRGCKQLLAVIKPTVVFLGTDQPAHKFTPDGYEIARVDSGRHESTSTTIKQILKAKEQDDQFQSGARWDADREWYR